MSAPQWTPDGEPANLEAAAHDAAVWLELVRLRFQHAPLVSANRAELDGCIAALHRLLPTPPDPGHEQAGGNG